MKYSGAPTQPFLCPNEDAPKRTDVIWSIVKL
jgi:hypothetical protein